MDRRFSRFLPDGSKRVRCVRCALGVRHRSASEVQHLQRPGTSRATTRRRERTAGHLNASDTPAAQKYRARSWRGCYAPILRSLDCPRAVKDTHIGDAEIPAGDLLFLHYAAADDDFAQFQNRDDFLPSRDGEQHLPSGRGAHSRFGSATRTSSNPTRTGKAFSRTPRSAACQRTGPCPPPDLSRALRVNGCRLVQR